MSKRSEIAVSFPRDRLKDVSFRAGTVVAGVTEAVDPAWGPAYRDRYPMTTSLLIRPASGDEAIWRPQGPQSNLSGYPLGDAIAVMQLVPQPTGECAPAVTRDCQKWALLVLRGNPLKAHILSTSRPMPFEVTPEPVFSEQTAYLTEATGNGTSQLLAIDLESGATRTVANLPFDEVHLSLLGAQRVLASETAAAHRLVNVDVRTGRIATLPSHPDAVAGPQAIAWVEPGPGSQDGATRIRVAQSDGTPVNAFGPTGLDTYYVEWIDSDTLLAVSVEGLDLYRKALTSHPERVRIPGGTDFAPEVGVQADDGRISFGLVDSQNVVHYVVLQV